MLARVQSAVSDVTTQIRPRHVRLARIKRHLPTPVQDMLNEARHAVKHSLHMAEDLVEEAAHVIKHHPFRALAIGFGVGSAAGATLGWMCARHLRD